MRNIAHGAAATASALFVVWASAASAGDFTPPPGWGPSEQTDSSTVYTRGPCGFAVGASKPLDGPFESAAEAYLDSAVKRNADRGEVIEKMGASTRLGNTGILTRAFVAHVNGQPTWNIRIVAPQGGALRPFYLRCTEAKAFKEAWPVVGQSVVDALGAAPAPRPSQEATGGNARLFLGKWYGANVMGQIDIHPDGTYSSPNGARGTWQATGDRSLAFTSGPLTAWNGGNAIISDKNALEFKWTTPQGHKQYFVYIRR